MITDTKSQPAAHVLQSIPAAEVAGPSAGTRARREGAGRGGGNDVVAQITENKDSVIFRVGPGVA